MLNWLIQNPLVKSYVLAAARHGATFVSGLLLAWLVKHGVGQTDASTAAQDIGGLILVGVSIAFSMLDVKKVDNQVATTAAQAAATASQAAAANPAVAKQIAAVSGSPEALGQLLTALRDGKAA